MLDTPCQGPGDGAIALEGVGMSDCVPGNGACAPEAAGGAPPPPPKRWVGMLSAAHIKGVSGM